MIELNKPKKIYLIITFLYLIVYIFWRIFFTLPFEYGIPSMILAAILLVCEITGVWESVRNIRGVLKDFNPDRPVISKDMYPDVDVLIATHDEPEDLLYKTINGCLHMDYPDKSKVHIYICDDGNRREIAELAGKMGVGYFGLAENAEAKAGNLNNALFKTHSPLVVTMDADMIPMSHFLINNVPYFFLPMLEKNKDGIWVKREKPLDEKIGFIQTPQSFYNTDLFQYNMYLEKKMPNEQDYFFRRVNIGRNRSNSAIYAGSNTIISREALEEIGGIVTGCITEDMATGIEIQRAGYKCYSVDEIAANGLAPIDVESLIRQRARWGRGCVHIMRKNHFFIGKGGKGLSLANKFSYLSSYTYWFSYLSKFMFVIIPPIAAITGLTIMRCKLWQVLLIYIPMYLLSSRSVMLVSNGSRDDKWNNITMMVLCPYLILPIFKENFGIREKKFWITNKNMGDAQKTNKKLVIPHVALLILSIVGVICTLRWIYMGQIIKYALILFWTVRSIYDIILSIMFIKGRSNCRKEERLNINESVKIKLSNNKELTAVTGDASEHGFSVMLSDPIFIDPNIDVEVVIGNSKYFAIMMADLLKTERVGDEWKYSFRITSISEKDKAEYYQILFDRIPALPQRIEKTMSYTDDLIANVSGRTKEIVGFRREYPRCVIDKEATYKNVNIYIKNFNYEYVLVKFDGEPVKEIKLAVTDDFVIEGIIDNLEFENGKTGDYYLYKVTNKEQLVSDDKIPKILSELYKEYSDKVDREALEEKRRRKIRKDEFNDVTLFASNAGIFILLCVTCLIFICAGTGKAYGAENVEIAGTYDWDDTMDVEVADAGNGYAISIVNSSETEAGYGQAGFIFSELMDSTIGELAFDIQNGESDIYISAGILNGNDDVIWQENNGYLAVETSEGKEIIYSDGNMHKIDANEECRVYVNFALYENVNNAKGLVIGIVVANDTRAEMLVKNFDSALKGEEISPVFESVEISGKNELVLHYMGEKTYGYTASEGWTFVPKEYTENISLDEQGVLHIYENAAATKLEIAAQNGEWITKKAVSIIDNPYIENVTFTDYSGVDDIDRGVINEYVGVTRIMCIVVLMILFLCYIIPRIRSKRRDA